MNQERYQLLKKLVVQALELPNHERDVFLQQKCEDLELLTEARDLLLHYRPDGTEADDSFTPPIDLPDLSGQKMGKYQIVEPIGEGGMGVVYLAAQSAPLRRKVALKVIKLGMDTREVISRFESERQALALMDHPNIAKVLDAGATKEGRPFFVMEYIPGVPLTQYCYDHDLGLRSRLDLFIQVCRGVQHAHQKGIIHRDLKPGNILVTEVEGKPVPKIIDFGVAKATGQHLAAQTMFTRMGQLIGTPEYMSPEQAGSSMADVDTRSDVYSLGVLLYELLTGTLPLERRDIMRAGLERMALHVQNEIPKKPSTRIDTEAKTQTGSSTVQGKITRVWGKRVRGDLDWITMKALEKERERRYGTAADLAEDLARHLNNHPVQAGPPSHLYIARKFVKRNRVGVVIGALFLASLVAGVIGTSVGLVKSQRSEMKAIAAADRAEGLTLFQMSRLEETPAEALPYILGALELEDRMEYRIHAKKLLLESLPYWRLPRVKNAHNPISVEFSPDGNWMAVGWGRDGKFQLYSLDGTEPRVLSEQRGPLYIAIFSPDSKYLVTSAGDSTVALWTPAEGKMIRKWKFPGRAIPYYDQARHRIIVATLVDGMARWQAVSLDGELTEEFGSIGGPAMTFFGPGFPDLDATRRWLVQPVGNRLELYDLENIAGGPIRIIGHHQKPVNGVAISPDGRTVVSYDDDGMVVIWDLAGAGVEPVRRLQANERPYAVTFNPSGTMLAVSGLRGQRVWDLTSGEAIEPLELNNASNWSFVGGFHPSGKWLVTAGTNGVVAAWPLKFEQPVKLKIPQANELSSLGFSPDGRHLIAGGSDGRIWDVPLKGTRIGNPALLNVQEDFRFTGIYFDDGSRYAFLSNCNGEKGAGIALRILLATGEATQYAGFGCNFVVDGQGRHLASIHEPGFGLEFVRVYDTTTGETRVLDESLGGFTLATGITRDGRILVVGPQGVGLWDNTRSEYQSIEGDFKMGWLAKDRQSVLLSSPDGELWRQVVDSPTREKLPVTFLKGGHHILEVDSTAVYLAGGHNYGPAQILDMEAGQRHIYPLFDSIGTWLAIDPKKRWIAAAGSEEIGIVKLITRPEGLPVEQLPADELLAWLRTLTNLRVQKDESAEFGFKVAGSGIPDWNNPPEW